MKIFNALILLFCFSISLQAQTFVIEIDSMSSSVDVEELYNASFDYPIIYNDSTVSEYKWTLEFDAPVEWQSQLCLNPVKCYPYDTKAAELAFEPGIDYDFALKIFHNNVCGEGDYILRLETLMGEVLEEVKSHVIATNCAITSTKETETIAITATPNPTSHSFNLLENTRVKSIMIYSSTGSLVKTFGQQTSYDVSGFTSGLYFLRIYDKDNNVQTTSLVIE